MEIIANFEIKNYTVEVRAATLLARQIRLVSTALTHGIDHDAALFFLREESDARIGRGTVENVDAPNFAGHSVIAHFALGEFEAISRMLQTEKPVFFHYNYPERGGSKRDLNFFSVGTSQEPLGEGPVDAQA